MTGLLSRRGPVPGGVTNRPTLCHLGLWLGGLALVLASLTLGTVRLTPVQALQALAGHESPALQLLVEWRLPRIGAALAAGAALGLSGALFQTLLRNPLGSPDVIGFDAGAFGGALLALLAGLAPALVALAAFGGGLGAGLLVYLAAGGLRADRTRLILIGIAVGSAFTAFADWMIFVAPLDIALVAANWKQGTLAGVDVQRLAIGAGMLGLLLPLGLACGRSVQALELGDDKAQSLGVPAGGTRLRLGLIGLGLTATATFIAGPIGFVALIAPQAARKLVGLAGLPLATSALFGAVFLLASDAVARIALAPRALPVGAVTACLGGAYLILLFGSWVRRGEPIR
ncbi:FecCD family ABC transporter permease [Bosea beijingensis]|uniref:FecCD family ABC transporter permease n=1 Tax=Bosea beijingensis TaxID=3068632 RepID=UPI0027423909|nr:iron chelate uptake ABC transporter family permease subunit [Bosea sp. REN20]